MLVQHDVLTSVSLLRRCLPMLPRSCSTPPRAPEHRMAVGPPGRRSTGPSAGSRSAAPPLVLVKSNGEVQTPLCTLLLSCSTGRLQIYAVLWPLFCAFVCCFVLLGRWWLLVAVGGRSSWKLGGNFLKLPQMASRSQAKGSEPTARSGGNFLKSPQMVEQPQIENV